MTAKNALALHTWTLDTTPLADLLKIVRSTGWDAVELRRLDWERADKAGQPASAVVDQAKASGLAESPASASRPGGSGRRARSGPASSGSSTSSARGRPLSGARG